MNVKNSDYCSFLKNNLDSEYRKTERNTDIGSQFIEFQKVRNSRGDPTCDSLVKNMSSFCLYA